MNNIDQEEIKKIKNDDKIKNTEKIIYEEIILKNIVHNANINKEEI